MVVIFAIIGICLYNYVGELRANSNVQLLEYQNKVDALISEKQKLHEQIATLTEQNSRQLSLLEKVQTGTKDSNSQLREYQSKVDALNSEKQQLREQIAALIEQNNRQLSLLEKLQTGTKDQREHLDAKLREYQIKTDAMNSENRILREQIALANRQNEFNKSQMDKERNAQASSVQLQESQFDENGAEYLIRCLGEKDSASETFTGLKVFWGALQLGYTTKNSLDNCLEMYYAIYRKKIVYK